MTTFSTPREFKTDEYSGTYGYSDGVAYVATCHDCGALVDEAARDKHAEWHRIWNGDES